MIEAYDKNSDDTITPGRSHIPVSELPPFNVIQTHDLLRLQLQGSESRRELINPPQLPEGLTEGGIDYSAAAVRTSALKYAAEVLPLDISEVLGIDHEIRDSIAVHTPPTLESVVLLAQAWDRVRQDKQNEETNIDNEKIAAALGASIDFLIDRETRDLFGHALEQAWNSGGSMMEAFHQVESEHYEHDVDDAPAYTEAGIAVPYFNIGDVTYDPHAPHADNVLVDRRDMMIVPEEIRHRLTRQLGEAAYSTQRPPRRNEEGTVEVNMSEILNS